MLSNSTLLKILACSNLSSADLVQIFAELKDTAYYLPAIRIAAATQSLYEHLVEEVIASKDTIALGNLLYRHPHAVTKMPYELPVEEWVFMVIHYRLKFGHYANAIPNLREAIQLVGDLPTNYHG